MFLKQTSIAISKLHENKKKKRETKPNTHLQVPQFAPVACLFDQLVIAFESYNDSLLQPIPKKKNNQCATPW